MTKLKIAAAAAGATIALAGGLAYGQRYKVIADRFGLPPARFGVKIERNLRVPMADGVTLAADHYYPSTPGDYPTLVRRTPYGRDNKSGPLGVFAATIAYLFAERGYHFIMQDVRGRFDSGGHFLPFENEGEDGYATLEWISQQPWFNGALGTWGESYNGWTQWTLTRKLPPYLKAMVPSITSAYSYSYVYGAEGAFATGGLLSWLMSLEAEANGWSLRRILNEVRPKQAAARFSKAANHLPLGQADEIAVGRPLHYFRKWLLHPRSEDHYWEFNVREKLVGLTVPVNLIGGWYDIFLYDVLADYATLRHGGQQPYLTIGPYGHDLQAVMASVREGLPWYERYLKGEAGNLRAQPVSIYVMGADEWRSYDEWPPPATLDRYYLQAGGRLSASEPPADSQADHYRYDPADPTPSLGGPLLTSDAGPVDNRPLEARPDVLTYTTAPLTQAIEVIGPVRLELYCRSSLDYADFFARLCDVQPDGRSINICDGLLRVRPGVGEVQPDGSRRIVVEMWATAQRFAAGHCLRLQVSSGAHPRINRNLGTAEPVLTATRLLTADQTIYHDAAHPSALVLPVV